MPCFVRGEYQEMGTELRKLFVLVREGFTEEMAPEMALKTEKLIYPAGKGAEGNHELSQGSRNLRRCVLQKWKGALYKFLRQKNVTISLTPTFIQG